MPSYSHPQTYCEGLASSDWSVSDLVILDGAGGGLPLRRQCGGGGVENPQVFGRLRRHWKHTGMWSEINSICICVRETISENDYDDVDEEDDEDGSYDDVLTIQRVMELEGLILGWEQQSDEV